MYNFEYDVCTNPRSELLIENEQFKITFLAAEHAGNWWSGYEVQTKNSRLVSGGIGYNGHRPRLDFKNTNFASLAQAKRYAIRRCVECLYYRKLEGHDIAATNNFLTAQQLPVGAQIKLFD